MTSQHSDQHVDDILRSLTDVIQQIKASAERMSAALPVETGNGESIHLSIAQYRIIVHLIKRGRSPVGEIAAGIGVTIATASHLIDKMVDLGWLEREVNPNDRRQVLIEMTERARTIAATFQRIRRTQVRDALGRLSPDDINAVERVFAAFAAALQSPIPIEDADPTDHDG